jgi:hypothetical protein
MAGAVLTEAAPATAAVAARMAASPAATAGVVEVVGVGVEGTRAGLGTG